MAYNPESNDTSNTSSPLRISRVFHARRPTVFRAWSTAEHVKRWFCPETFTVAEAHVEMRVGGAFDVCMRSPAGEDHWVRGTFAEVVPDQRLVIDMRATDGDGIALFRAYTEVAFSDSLGGTQVDIVQTYTLFDPSIAAPMIQGAAVGWRTTLDKLEREAIRTQSGSDIAARTVAHAVFHLERTYPASVARVWKALTDSDAKAKWFSGTPDRWTLIERHLDVRVGGTERLQGRWEGGLISTFDAIYHDVIENERLVYSYSMHLDERKISVSLATLQLKPANGKTTLTITEQGAFLDGYDDAGAREHGTGALLDALGASLDT